MRTFDRFLVATFGLGLLIGQAAQAQQTVGGSVAAGSTLDVKGSIAAGYISVTATTYTIAATDHYVVYNGTAAGTFTLPAANSGTAPLAANFKGRLYNIRNNTTNQTLTVQAAGSETIDGTNTITVPAGQTAELVNNGASSGTTWEVVKIATSSAATPVVAGADNGLTVGYNSSGKVGLGGTLAKATDVATAGNNLTFSGTGYVGIGTTSPSLNLDVVGGSTFGVGARLRNTAAQNSASAVLFLGNDANAFGASLIYNSSVSTTASGPNALGLVNSGNYPLTFGTNSAERVRIDGAGNVGIGTPTPGALLDVVGTVDGNVNARIYNKSTGVNNTAQLIFGTDAGSAAAYIYNTGANSTNAYGARTLVFGNGSNTGAFSFQQAGTERIRIGSTGNVGIGTTAPTPGSTLQIAGSLAANIRTITTGTVADNDHTLLVGGNISLPAPSTTNTGRIYNLVNSSTGSPVVTGTLRDGGSSGTIASFTLGTSTGIKALTVQSDGTQWWIISRN